MIPKSMHIRTRVHTLQEGWDLCCAIMKKGYEGVQNDSSRYNDTALAAHFNQRGYCWVGVWGHSLYILNTHDKNGKRKLKELGKCKFIQELELSVCKRDMPKSLKLYAKNEEQNMEWKELKWYKADKDYSFSFVKCLVIAKNGNVVIRDNAKKGEYYIPLPLIKDLPKD